MCWWCQFPPFLVAQVTMDLALGPLPPRILRKCYLGTWPALLTLEGSNSKQHVSWSMTNVSATVEAATVSIDGIVVHNGFQVFLYFPELDVDATRGRVSNLTHNLCGRRRR